LGSYHYKAFISYSHKDHRWGGWLHRRLERYRIPKHLLKGGQSERLKPIFRDREELAAADSLGEKIEQAIAASENLIVICSPHAAQSHWVNQEVLSFKRQNRGAKIFSIIVEGEPFSGGADECMPPALRFQLGADGELTDEPAEPLAADLRSTGDGKRLGVLKIISGMLGVGLDELVQRDLQRNRNRVTAITASALATVLAMGTLTGFALSAKKQAEAARMEADNRRDAAEDMIEFMITDLKPKLDSVGRLDVLSVVGERAAKYYDDQPLTAHNDNALGRRARVFHLLGEIEDKYGNLDKAQEKFNAAYASTKELLVRDPNNADRIFDHAQSAYWVGLVPYRQENYAEAELYFHKYVNLAKRLEEAEPKNLRSMQEITYAHTNLGITYFYQRKFTQALDIFKKTIPAFENIANETPRKTIPKIDLANIYGWIADTLKNLDQANDAIQYRQSQRQIYKTILAKNPNNHNVIYQDLNSLTGLAIIAIDQEKFVLAERTIKIGLTSAIKLLKVEKSNVKWVESYGYLQLLMADIHQKNSNYSASKQLLEVVKQIELDLESLSKSTQFNVQKLKNKRLSLEASLTASNETVTPK